MRKLFFWLALLLAWPNLMYARPVSYPGGYTIMTRNDADLNSLHLHYSPSARYSVGYRGEYWRNDKHWLHSFAVNNLLKRWNRPASQANLYLRSGLGFAYSDEDPFDKEYEPLTYSGLATDWENQRYFASYQFRLIYAGDIDKSFHQMGRLGVAPYIGNYGDLHTWVMVQVAHHPGTEDSFTVTPLLRFFMGVYLLETGVSDKGDLLLNAIIRY